MDLSLVPMEKLADELVRRGSTAIVFVVGVDNEFAYYNWVGDHYKALGLCEEMKHKIFTGELSDE